MLAGASVADAAPRVRGSVPTVRRARARSRDEQIAALFDEHRADLCRLAALLLSDRGAAEEVVQEAFLRTFASWRRLRRPERARWYLRAAVVNQCRSRVRRRWAEDRSNRTVWTTRTHEVVHHVWDTDQGADALRVLAAVRALPLRQREAVVLRYYEDLSEADMAAVLGCSVGTVKSQLAKARAALARSLGEPEEGGDGSGRA